MLLPACGGEEKPKPPASKSKTTQRASAPNSLIQKMLQVAAHVAANPNDNEARLTLANLYYDAKRPDLAAPIYKTALERQPDHFDARTDLGTCYKRLGKLDLARAEYERVIAEHPDHVQATFNLAVVVELAGDPQRAAKLWERVATLAPGTPMARTSLEYAASARSGAGPAAKTAPPKEESRP